jgi:hypothetical protein
MYLSYLKERVLCRYYQRNRTCRFGSNCRFLHQTSSEEYDYYSDINNSIQEDFPINQMNIQFPLHFVPFDKRNPRPTTIDPPKGCKQWFIDI